MSDFASIHAFLSNWTPGAVGVWTGVAVLLVGWWKGLPSFIEAIGNRQSKIEERMGKLLEDATARFQREIAAADQRHDDCMEGQQLLQGEVARLRDCVNEQQEEIVGLKRQILSMQTAAIRLEGNAPSPIIVGMVDSLDKMGSKE